MKKFIIRYSPKFKGTERLKSFKPIEKKFTDKLLHLDKKQQKRLLDVQSLES